MTPVFILFLLAGTVAFIILSVSYLKLHPVLSLLLAALGVGIIAGMDPIAVIEAILGGFGKILGSIGLVIVLGSIIGELLEKSGAAQAIARGILRTIGKKDPTSALILLGGIVGIPVFCDVGYILLSKITAGISSTRKIPYKTLSAGLAGGLYCTHTLIPPTPGPIAAAANYGVSHQLGQVILMGLLVTIPVLLIVRLLLRSFKFEYQELDDKEQTESSSISISRAAFVLALPILLISSGALLRLIALDYSYAKWLLFAGNPMIALLISVLVGFWLLPSSPAHPPMKLVTNAVQAAGPILILTGAGGAFGNLLKEAGFGDALTGLIGNQTGNLMTLVVISFLLSAVLKTSQGSSTSAIVIASSIMGPIAYTAGVVEPTQLTLLVMATGGGAMTVSHANDSYFWVVSQFGGMTVKEAYRSFTVLTAVQGATVLAIVLAISWIISL